MIQLHVWFNSPIYKSKVGQDSKSYFNFPIRLFNSQKKTVQYGITQNTNEKWSSLTFGLFFSVKGPQGLINLNNFLPFSQGSTPGPILVAPWPVWPCVPRGRRRTALPPRGAGNGWHGERKCWRWWWDWEARQRCRKNMHETYRMNDESLLGLFGSLLGFFGWLVS